jgi:hypothetical protein
MGSSGREFPLPSYSVKFGGAPLTPDVESVGKGENTVISWHYTAFHGSISALSNGHTP